MLQQAEARRTFVIATGEQHSVREFVETRRRPVDMRRRLEGQGRGGSRRGRETGRTIVRIDPRYFRPTEVETLLGDAPAKARRELGWVPEIGVRCSRARR